LLFNEITHLCTGGKESIRSTLYWFHGSWYASYHQIWWNIYVPSQQICS